MEKKIWFGLLGLIFLMIPALVGATTCYNQSGLLIDCEDWVDAYGSTTTTTTSSDPIVGTWNWFNGKVYDLNDDKSIVEGTEDVGVWANESDPRKYKLTWDFGGYVDKVTLSDDGDMLEGTNQSGMVITATRQSDGNNSTCQATLDSDLSIHIPYLKSVLPMVEAQYFEMDLALVSNPFYGYSTGLFFEMTSFSTVAANLLCTPADLKSADELDYVKNPNTVNNTPVNAGYVIRIPNVKLWNGDSIEVLELLYDTVNSDEEHAYFLISLYAYDD